MLTDSVLWAESPCKHSSTFRIVHSHFRHSRLPTITSLSYCYGRMHPNSTERKLEKERAYDEDIAQENMWYLARLAKWITLPSDSEVI